MVNGVNTRTTQALGKPAIGVLIDSVDSLFLAHTIEDLLDAAEDQDIHLVFYFGGFLEKGKTAGPYSYAYTLPDPDEIKALIILPHSVAPWTPRETLNLIRDQFPDIPIYSLYANFPDYCCAYAHEYAAIDSMVQHLVDDHGYKRFAVMLGANAPDSLSRDRLTRIKTALSDRQIDIDATNLF